MERERESGRERVRERESGRQWERKRAGEGERKGQKNSIVRIEFSMSKCDIRPHFECQNRI